MDPGHASFAHASFQMYCPVSNVSISASKPKASRHTLICTNEKRAVVINIGIQSLIFETAGL